MSTQPNLPPAGTEPPDDSLQQQQQFDAAANAYNTAYSMEQKEVAQLQSDITNMTTWAQLLEFLAALSSLSQLMTACKVTGDECAESLAGLLQGAESIFSDGVQECNELSQQAWESGNLDIAGGYTSDYGVPIVSVSNLNSTYATQVANAQLFINYLQDIYYDVSGAEFTGANPLSGISAAIQETLQDIMYQVVMTYNAMYFNLNDVILNSGAVYFYYTPDSSNQQSTSSYSQEYSSEINDPTGTPPPNYLFDPTEYADTGSETSNGSPMAGASAADMVCYAMLNWFFVYATPVNYSGFTPAEPVYAPGMTQNQSAYQVENDMATINSSTTGFAPQSMPVIGFLTTLTSNALAAIGNYLKDIASLSQTVISNTNQ